MERLRHLWPYLLVFGVACGVHLLVVGAALWEERYPEGSADEARYVFYGESIRAGRGMHAPGYEDRPTAYVMPNLPLMIAAIGADSLVWIRLAQVGVAALVAVLTFWMGKTTFQSTSMGYLTVGLLLLNFEWTIQPLYILTEPLFTLFFLVGMLGLMFYPQDKRVLAGVGVAFGLAWLTRGALIGPLLVIFPYLWWRFGFQRMAIVGVMLGLTVLPWVGRNYSAFEALVPTSTQSGHVLAGAYNDHVYADPWGDSWRNPDAFYAADAAEQGIFDDEVAYSNYLSGRGQDWILQNPHKIPKLWLAHTFGYVRPWPKLTRNALELGYVLVTWLVGVVLLGWGTWQGLRNPTDALNLTLLAILGGFLTALIFYATPRFRVPYEPYFALLMAMGWQALANRFSNAPSES